MTLDDALAALTAGTLADGEHPSPDELVAYHLGEPSSDADGARLQEHLSWCDECANAILELESWPDVELRDPQLERTAAEEADDWQAIQRRLARHGVGSDKPVSDSSETASEPLELPQATCDLPPAVLPPSNYGPIHLLAAALLVAVIGLSVQVARLSHRSATIDAPRTNLFVVDLEPDGTSRDRNAGHRATQVPAGMSTVVFLLIQEDLRTFADHAVELRDENDDLFWQAGDLVSPPEGGFSVAVPLATLPSDSIEIRLYGIDEGQRELLATYRTHIERTAVP